MKKTSASNHSVLSKRAIKKDVETQKAMINVIKKRKRTNENSSSQRKNRESEKKKHLQRNKMWKIFDRKAIDGGDQGEDFDNTKISFFKHYKDQLREYFESDNSEEEWMKFVKCCGEDLKVTFRLAQTSFPQISNILEDRLFREFSMKGKIIKDNDGNIIKNDIVKKLNIQSLNFSLWKLNVSHQQLAKVAALKGLKSFISRYSEIGFLIRQAVDSMIPVFALEIQPDHSVLDMCAAPGSKSEQILHLLDLEKGGILVSNDPDGSRLKSISKRFAHIDRSNIALLNEYGQDLPRKLTGNLLFDRILADVPCSGDGTIRKQPHLLRNWKEDNLLSLTQLQLELAKSAFSMLKVGGRMVYSTCSMNPKENEEVIKLLLESVNGRSKKCIAVREALIPDGLRYRKGLRRYGDEISKCLRILPHDNDTGGFFLAVLEKISNTNSNDLTPVVERDYTFHDHQKFKAITKNRASLLQVSDPSTDAQQFFLDTLSCSRLPGFLTLHSVGEDSLILVSKRLQVLKNIEALRISKLGCSVGVIEPDFLGFKCGSSLALAKLLPTPFNLDMTENSKQFLLISKMIQEVSENHDTNKDSVVEAPKVEFSWIRAILADSLEDLAVKNLLEKLEELPSSHLFSFQLKLDTKSTLNANSLVQPKMQSHKPRISKKQRKLLKKGLIQINSLQKASVEVSSTSKSSINATCSDDCKILCYKVNRSCFHILTSSQLLKIFNEIAEVSLVPH